jgi:hypothetical protein
VGLFDRFFGKGRDARTARAAELRGELAKAAELYGLAGMPEEAARVMVLRGDAETDPRQRILYYTQAIATAPEGTEPKKTARVRRAELVVAQFSGGAVSAAARKELCDAAADLERAGEPLRAAQVYEVAGDHDGQARALAAAGDVERLEFLLSEQQRQERAERRRESAAREYDVLVASGRRREALSSLEALAPHEARLAADKGRAIRAKRVLAPLVPMELHGRAVTLVLGEEVVVGRTEGTLLVASQAVSRRHVRIAREKGAITVRDLGSRNGTQLRGMSLVGAVPVGEGLELTLGKEVRLELRPERTLFSDALRIDLGGTTYVAPLGPGRIEPEGWRLRAGDDGWVELVSSPEAPAYMAGNLLDPVATLLVGDAIGRERGGAPVLRVTGT